MKVDDSLSFFVRFLVQESSSLNQDMMSEVQKLSDDKDRATNEANENLEVRTSFPFLPILKSRSCCTLNSYIKDLVMILRAIA